MIVLCLCVCSNSLWSCELTKGRSGKYWFSWHLRGGRRVPPNSASKDGGKDSQSDPSQEIWSITIELTPWQISVSMVPHLLKVNQYNSTGNKVASSTRGTGWWSIFLCGHFHIPFYGVALNQINTCTSLGTQETRSTCVSVYSLAVTITVLAIVPPLLPCSK